MDKMSLRNALASALQLLRSKRGLSQQDLSGTVTQSHISQVESAKTSLTTDSLEDLCGGLQVHPVAFMALVYAAKTQTSAAQVLAIAEADLKELRLLKGLVRPEPEKQPHPRVIEASGDRMEVRQLRDAGHSQAEISKILGMAPSTVRRHWHREGTVK